VSGQGGVALEARGVVMRFGGLTALTGFDLSLRIGELVGLIGPNGAGKTTAFNALTGVYAPTEGTVEVAGRRVNGLRPHQICELGVARTFQNVRLFKDLTAFDNVRIACHAGSRSGFTSAWMLTPTHDAEEERIRQRASDFLAVLELSHRRDELARNLPYGEQRKLEIAIAMACKPELLLLDEPAAGMNPEEKIRLMGMIRKIRDQGITILLVDHDMKMVMGVCEKIVVLNYGEKIVEGTPGEVSENPEVIKVYLGEDSGAAYH